METGIKVEAYVPNGGMCVNCQNMHRYCGRLDFESMPVINVVSEPSLLTKIVKCTEFKKNDK